MLEFDMSVLCPCPKLSQTLYRPRRPENTVLFSIIKKYYNTWKKNTQNPIPCYVDKTFKKYLDCGNLAKGFACAHCECCNTNFFIAFSCKMRGVCPSCNTKSMVFNAAHLIENVLPIVPFRQWVISFPLRIRHYLLENDTLQDVLDIIVDEIQKTVIHCSLDIPNAQIGAVSYFQNFGSTLNLHPHFHIIASDGVFYRTSESLQFQEAVITQDDIDNTQKSIQKRILHFFEKRGFFNHEEIEKMQSYENSGFSLNANVKIASWDRKGLERVIRYCARPCFAGENLRMNGQWIIYRLSKPTHRGQISILLCLTFNTYEGLYKIPYDKNIA
jgi:hypothetical protein